MLRIEVKLVNQNGDCKCFGSYSIKLKKIRNQFQKYSRLNNGGYSNFYAAKQVLVVTIVYAIGITEPAAFLRSLEFSVIFNKADVGRVCASSTLVYGTGLFLFVPPAGHTDLILDTSQYSLEFWSEESPYS